LGGSIAACEAAIRRPQEDLATVDCFRLVVKGSTDAKQVSSLLDA
jgi:hypothetical protein